MLTEEKIEEMVLNAVQDFKKPQFLLLSKEAHMDLAAAFVPKQRFGAGENQGPIKISKYNSNVDSVSLEIVIVDGPDYFVGLGYLP